MTRILSEPIWRYVLVLAVLATGLSATTASFPVQASQSSGAGAGK
jgi:hypothetical protein